MPRSRLSVVEREANRIHRIHLDRAARIQRIQDLHYPTFWAFYAPWHLPIPPRVWWGGRADWERAYRVWRDLVLWAVEHIDQHGALVSSIIIAVPRYSDLQF